jgi:rare lipoprotein A
MATVTAVAAATALALTLATTVAQAKPCPHDLASWYGARHAGHLTANGERFNPRAMTAASRRWPLGSRVLVYANHRAVVVRINDHGPYHHRCRVLDLSHAAARHLGVAHAGVVPVKTWRVD